MHICMRYGIRNTTPHYDAPLIRFLACLIRTKLVSTRLRRKLKLMLRGDANFPGIDDSIPTRGLNTKAGPKHLSFIVSIRIQLEV